MKKEDFQKWINDDLSDNALGNFETEIMNNLLEHRLQQEFKLRLQARRVRQMYLKWALIGLLIVGVLMGLFYFFKNNKKADLGQVEPSKEQLKTLNDTLQTMPLSVVDGHKMIENPVKKATNPTDNNSITPLNPKSRIVPQSDKIASDNAHFNVKNVLKDRFSSPVDTEYIYLKSSNDPITYQRYASNGDVEKPISDITFLNLSKKKLKEIPPSVFEHERLKYLQLNNNQITELPVGIGQLHELENLNLKNNKLANLPKELTTLKSLRILNLQNNQLKELPSQMDELTELRELILNDNKLSELPFEIGKFTQLTNLDLGNNNLKVLSNGIEHLSKLKSLNLRNNRLTEIPENITQLTNLKWLDLGRNKLKKIPEELFEMKNLEFLNLSGNDIPAGEVNQLGEELPNCRIIFF